MTEKTLNQRIIDQIRHDGPIPVSVYMQLALHDRQQGYYATRPGLMRDFATAPEISQTFGELIGLWVVEEWKSLGCPSPIQLIEVGPGRGVMMSDIVRAVSTCPEFTKAVAIHLVEPSPKLQALQKERLPLPNIHWHNTLADVPSAPFLLVANEWLDCLPIRQFVKQDQTWHERLVGLDENQQLTFGLSPPVIDLPNQVPIDMDQFEASPALEAIVLELADRLQENAGRVLLIDYGPTNAVPEDSLRAYQNGSQKSPLHSPGETDITADVDFRTLCELAKAQKLDTFGPVPQGLFLKRLGIEARVSRLMSDNPGKAQQIASAAMRICDPDDMGTRFNCVCLSKSGHKTPLGF